MLAGHLVLDVKVKAVRDVELNYVTGTRGRNGPKSFASEKDIERFAVCHVLFASEENPISGVIRTGNLGKKVGDFLPVVRENYLFGGMNETGLSVGRGVEDFTRILV